MIKHNLPENQLDTNAAPALKWYIHSAPTHWRYIQQAELMRSHIKFFVFYLCTLATAIGLVLLASSIEPVNEIMSQFWGVYIISQCWALMIGGIGLAAPVIVIIFGFGWLQLFLLANGQIEPHMTSEGFGSALKTIFGKIL